MSLQFKGTNTRLDDLRRLEFLRPISFRDRGAITSINRVETKALKAGPVKLTNQGDVTGVNRLHCKGQISSDVGLSLSEFTTSGRVQSGGPVTASLNGGYTHSIGVGSHDTDYGRSDPYYTRLYECNLPDTNSKLYIYSIDSDNSHLQISQGSYTYRYNFPVGWYTSTELCAYFNNQLQYSNKSPLLLSYDSEQDMFTLSVDDSYGASNENATDYTQEFYIEKSSLLLQRLGFISTLVARNPTGLQDIRSVGRVLTSSHDTFFRNISGYSQGFYFGGIKNDAYSEVWSPAMNIWVGSDPSQNFRSRVLKEMSPSRLSSGLTNEQLSVTTLGSSNLLSIEATITSPFFDFNNSDIPEEYLITPSETRGQLLPIIEVSDRGSVTVIGTDDIPLYSGDGILQGPSFGHATIHLRSRNPKTKDTGPILAFEGALSNCSMAGDSTTTTYAAIKAVPTSQLGNGVDTNSGGQIVFMTTPQAISVPKEAMRINESQQVFVGAATSRPTEEKLIVKGSSFFDGNKCITGTVAIGTSISNQALTISGDAALTGEVLLSKSVTINGSITCDTFQLMQSDVQAIIDGLSESYEQISIVASPEPSFSGIQVTNVLKANQITDPDDTTGSITMDQATFTSASIKNVTVNTLTSSENAELTTVNVSSEISCPQATFTSVTSTDADITNVNAELFTGSVGIFTNASIIVLSGRDITLSGSLSVTEGIHGTLHSPTQPNITGVGTLVSLDVAQSIIASSGGEFSGICTANAGLIGTLFTANQPKITGVGTLMNLHAIDGTIQTLTSTTATIDSLHLNSDLTSQNALTDNVICTDVFASGVVTAPSITANSIYLSTSISSQSGIFTGVCSSSTGFSGTVLTPQQPNISSVGSLASLDVFSTTQTKDLVVDNTCSASTYIGTLLTSHQPYITRVGNLQTLDVNERLSSGSINTGGICTATSGFVGSILTPYQPAIKKVGTLESLTVSGDSEFGSICVFKQAAGRVGINSSIPVRTLDVVGDANFTSNLSVGGTIYAQGVASALGGLYTQGIVTSTEGIVGTLVTASQPNITGVGTLTSLNLAGDIVASGSAKINGICTASSFVGSSFVGSSFVGTSLNLTGTASASSFIGTNYTLSGTASMGTLQVGSLSNWTPDFLITSASYNTSFVDSETGDCARGYQVFPGGFCIQWGWRWRHEGGGWRTWRFPKTFTYIYGAILTPIYQNVIICRGMAFMNALTTSYVTYDPNYGDSNKMHTFIIAFGKI